MYPDKIKKILIIRLSAIGDVILTSPAVRQLKARLPEAEIHYLIKKSYAFLPASDPSIHKVWEYETEIVSELKQEHFDVCLDWQANLRSFRVKRGLSTRYFTVKKCNFSKWKMVRLKSRLEVPPISLRYLQTLSGLGIEPDLTDLRPHLFLPDAALNRADELITPFQSVHPDFYGLVLGATYFTKRWNENYFVPFILSLNRPAVLFGGPEERPLAKKILAEIKERVPVYDAVGAGDFLTCAGILRRCRWVLTHDTGMMHAATALGVRTAVLWGNTVPGFGFAPQGASEPVLNLEIKDLACRPCSKIGYGACPKGHFKCMNLLTPERVIGELEGEDVLVL